MEVSGCGGCSPVVGAGKVLLWAPLQQALQRPPVPPGWGLSHTVTHTVHASLQVSEAAR